MRNIIIISLLLIGCSTYPIKRSNIVHDYIFENAIKMCENHEGLHYILADTTIFAEKSHKFAEYGDDDSDYPCKDTFKFRCQDGTLLNFDDGAGYCFISESQFKETMDNK